MKKFIFALLMTLTLTLSVGCKKEKPTPTPPEPPVENKTVELIVDNTFQNGFIISPANGTYIPEGYDRWAFDYTFDPLNNKKASWSVGQHGCTYGLADEYVFNDKEVEFENGYYKYSDHSKVLSVNPTTGSLIFELNASKEFLKPRENKEGWPHLIMQNVFTEQLMLSDVEALNLSMDVEMLKMERHMTDEEYKESLHTIQYIMYIYVYSNNALDAGEFLFFGIPIYDYRYKVMKESGMIDAGTAGNTGKFIYQMSTLGYLPDGLSVGKKEEIRIDILDSIGSALLLARQFDKLKNSSIDDLYITSMNIGFEIPGTFDCAIELSNFSLLATKK